MAHCGDSTAGDHVWSLTFTDVLTQWTENRACFNKGQHAVCQRVAAVEAELPFPILGFDCDNGSEFLNHHLVAYFHARPRKVAFTRSRPYRKNDNARVEQKNWTHVRQLVGYGRLGDPRQAEMLDALYRQLWNPWRNFFCPAMRLIEKRREGSRILRRYDRPQTPFERLKASGKIEPAKIAELQRQMDAPRSLRDEDARSNRGSRPSCDGTPTTDQDRGMNHPGPRTLGPASSACAALRPPRRGQDRRRSGVVSYESTNPQKNHSPVSSLLESTRRAVAKGLRPSAVPPEPKPTRASLRAERLMRSPEGHENHAPVSALLERPALGTAPEGFVAVGADPLAGPIDGLQSGADGSRGQEDDPRDASRLQPLIGPVPPASA